MLRKILFISSVTLLFLTIPYPALADVSAQLKEAGTLVKNKQYEQAEAIYQQIVTAFPDTNEALEAQKQLTLVYITSDRQQEADAAFEKLIASFSEHKGIAEAVWQIARKYNESKKNEKALQLHQYNVDHFSRDKYAMWSQVEIVYSHIRSGNFAAADAGFDKLLTAFSGQPTLPKEIYQVARKYADLKRNDKSLELYQYNIDRFPKDMYAMWSQIEIIKSYMGTGEPAADAAVDKLLTVFSGQPTLPKEVYQIANSYNESKQYNRARRLYQHIIDNWPQSSQVLFAQSGLVWSSIALGNDPNTEAAVDKLLTNFSKDPNAAKPISDIADFYRQAKNYRNACELYQHIADHWPKTEQGIWAQANLIKSYHDLGEMEAAEAAVGKLLANFSDNSLIARVVWDTARYYRGLNKYEKALQLHRYNADHFSGDMYAMWSQVEIIKYHIRDANEPAADAAFNKLLAVFYQQPTISKEIYEVADEYDKVGRYDKANQLYQYVVEDWPGSTGEMWVKASIAKLNIALGDDASVHDIIDNLIADFNDQARLPQAIFQIGEEYYYKAMADATQGRTNQADANFVKTLSVWDRIIIQMPDSNSTATAHAYYFSAGCYRKLGKYEKAVEHFQTVVDTWPNYQYAWSAQCLIGECYEKLRDSGAISEAEANPLIEQAYQAVIEKYPDCSLVGHACLKLGDMYLQKGSRDEAVACLELFLAKAHPDDPRREMVKARLEKLGGYNK